MIDIHSHIVFQVDDGAKSLEESLKLLKKSWSQGVRKMVATPHYQKRLFPYDRENIIHNFERLQEVANLHVPDLELFLGTEIFCERDAAQIVEKKEFLTINHTPYILVEFPVGVGFLEICRELHTFSNHGYFPIVAHVERYRNLGEKEIETLVDRGNYMQINADSLLGPRIDLGAGREVRKRAKVYFKEELVHFVSSDTHDLVRRTSTMQEARERGKAMASSDYLNQVFYSNGEQMLKGIEI